jgi:hypothetical protein
LMIGIKTARYLCCIDAYHQVDISAVLMLIIKSVDTSAVFMTIIKSIPLLYL